VAVEEVAENAAAKEAEGREKGNKEGEARGEENLAAWGKVVGLMGAVTVGTVMENQAVQTGVVAAGAVAPVREQRMAVRATGAANVAGSVQTVVLAAVVDGVEKVVARVVGREEMDELEVKGEEAKGEEMVKAWELRVEFLVAVTEGMAKVQMGWGRGPAAVWVAVLVKRDPKKASHVVLVRMEMVVPVAHLLRVEDVVERAMATKVEKTEGQCLVKEVLREEDRLAAGRLRGSAGFPGTLKEKKEVARVALGVEGTRAHSAVAPTAEAMVDEVDWLELVQPEVRLAEKVAPRTELESTVMGPGESRANGGMVVGEEELAGCSVVAVRVEEQPVEKPVDVKGGEQEVGKPEVRMVEEKVAEKVAERAAVGRVEEQVVGRAAEEKVEEQVVGRVVVEKVEEQAVGKVVAGRVAEREEEEDAME